MGDGDLFIHTLPARRGVRRAGPKLSEFRQLLLPGERLDMPGKPGARIVILASLLRRASKDGEDLAQCKAPEERRALAGLDPCAEQRQRLYPPAAAFRFPAATFASCGNASWNASPILAMVGPMPAALITRPASFSESAS